MSPSARVMMVVGALAAIGLLIALSSCTSRIKRLDEAVIVDSPTLKLKVDGWDLPEHLVHQAPKPAHCNGGRPACPWENFRGDRSLRFSEVKVDSRSEQISMLVDSTAFKNNKRMAVSSVDGGKTWTVVPVDKGVAEQSIQPDRREDAAPG